LGGAGPTGGAGPGGGTGGVRPAWLRVGRRVGRPPPKCSLFGQDKGCLRGFHRAHPAASPRHTAAVAGYDMDGPKDGPALSREAATLLLRYGELAQARGLLARGAAGPRAGGPASLGSAGAQAPPPLPSLTAAAPSAMPPSLFSRPACRPLPPHAALPPPALPSQAAYRLSTDRRKFTVWGHATAEAPQLLSHLKADYPLPPGATRAAPGSGTGDV
jgi:hypothetical protein